MGLHAVLLRKVLQFASPRARQARMAHFITTMAITPGLRVLDLGGRTNVWRFCDVPLDITILNLDDEVVDRRQRGQHRFTFVTGDATGHLDYADNSFDLVFSNSCIEHVGDDAKQAAFAREVRRLAPSYWVQTPALTFPIEAHTGLPFWWFYPAAVRAALIRRWKRADPAYGDFVAGTRVVRLRALRAMFPDATLATERVAGFAKSYTVWRRG